MSLRLARVDERLIHGQVSVGWVPALSVNAILVADDLLVEDDWEREMVESAAPSGLSVTVLRVVPAAARLRQGIPGEVLLLLVRSPASMLELVRSGAPVAEVNLGGLHFRDGARRCLDYLYLTREDIEALKGLAALGVRLVAQDLPGHSQTELNPLLAEGHLEYDQLHPGHS